MKQNTTTQVNKIKNCVKSHKLSLSILLVAYGTFYLISVIMSYWTPLDWITDVSEVPQTVITPLIPPNIFNLFFFVTSLPALIFGAVSLCLYNIYEIKTKENFNTEHIAILLTSFGFIYVVIGAWPLGNPVGFPWDWQRQIISYGPFFSWVLYCLALLVLVVGVISLYVHSRNYRSIQNELSND